MQSPSPAWPAPGSGNLVIFNSGPDSCRAAEAAVGGYFYLGGYSPDVLQLTKRPLDDRAVVAQCTPFIEHDLENTDLGFFVVSQGAAVPGCNPCAEPCSGVIPVRAVTWSSLKSLYH